MGLLCSKWGSFMKISTRLLLFFYTFLFAFNAVPMMASVQGRSYKESVAQGVANTVEFGKQTAAAVFDGTQQTVKGGMSQDIRQYAEPVKELVAVVRQGPTAHDLALWSVCTGWTLKKDILQHVLADDNMVKRGVKNVAQWVIAKTKYDEYQSPDGSLFYKAGHFFLSGPTRLVAAGINESAKSLLKEKTVAERLIDYPAWIACYGIAGGVNAAGKAVTAGGTLVWNGVAKSLCDKQYCAPATMRAVGSWGSFLVNGSVRAYYYYQFPDALLVDAACKVGGCMWNDINFFDEWDKGDRAEELEALIAMRLAKHVEFSKIHILKVETTQSVVNGELVKIPMVVLCIDDENLSEEKKAEYTKLLIGQEGEQPILTQICGIKELSEDAQYALRDKWHWLKSSMDGSIVYCLTNGCTRVAANTLLGPESCGEF